MKNTKESYVVLSMSNGKVSGKTRTSNKLLAERISRPESKVLITVKAHGNH